jgi:hypothetical protein
MTTLYLVFAGLLLWPSSVPCQDISGAQIVRGKVFDSGYGTVVEGATVNLRDATLEISAVSDADGRYLIERIPPGHYIVTVTCPGFATYHSEVTVSRVPTALNIAISVGLQDIPGVVVEGTVTDSDARALEGVTVVVASPFDKTVLERATTQADGRYTVTVPRPGQYVVYASKEGHQAVAKTVLAASERTKSNFTLPDFHL